MDVSNPCIVACMKWVVPEGADHRFGGISAADAAALEWALRIGEAGHSTGSSLDVIAITVGPPEAEAALRDALACGAAAAIRVSTGDASGDGPGLTSEQVAALIVAACQRAGHVPGTVVCGDYSLDRGTGSVPAYLADLLGAEQALGLIGLEIGLEIPGDAITATRRLDGGRRERLAISPPGTAPAVLSVEGGTATLRRAPLAAALRAKQAAITVLDPAGLVSGALLPGALLPGTLGHDAQVTRRPYRPRARELAAPVGAQAIDRVQAVLGVAGAAGTSGAAGGASDHRSTEVLEPAAAADRIIDALRAWGYLGGTE